MGNIMILSIYKTCKDNLLKNTKGNMLTWDEIKESYKGYLDTIPKKQVMAHKVAYDVLGSSYQIMFTIDYMKWVAKQEKEKEQVEEKPKRIVRRIKRSQLKIKNKNKK